MIAPRNVSCLLLCLGLVAACSPAPAPVAEPATPAPAPAPAAAPASPAAPVAPPVDAAASPIGFAGYAGVPFGNPEDELVDRGMVGFPPTEAGGCHFLHLAEDKAEPPAMSFMAEGGRFARIDVGSPDLVAPGGGRVGSTLAALRAAYPGLEEQPHKYVEGGKVVVVAAPDGGPVRLVFEVDATGKVTHWRLGVPPQVHYVEGCA